jgi:hypothetical protein
VGKPFKWKGTFLKPFKTLFDSGKTFFGKIEAFLVAALPLLVTFLKILSDTSLIRQFR